MRGTLFISLGLLGMSTISILLVLAGTSKLVLVNWFFLKANAGALSISSKLSNSPYLSDLTKLTGTDLVGSNATSSSLGIGNWTTVSLFTSCTETDSSVTCTTPRFGFSFNPSTGLKLDSTGLEGSRGLVSIPSYGSLSQFLEIAYILALLFTILTIGLNILSCCIPRAIVASALTSILAALFLIGASSAAIGVFTNLRGKYNAVLLSAGIKTALGNNLFIASWIATMLILPNSITICLSYRHNNKHGRQRGMARGVGFIDHSGMDKSGVGTEVFAAPKRRRTLQLLKKVGTWSRQKYTQIEKQQAVRGIPDDDDDILNRRVFGGAEDEEEEEVELVRNSTRGIQLQPFENSHTRDVTSTYEPYRQVGAE